MIVLMVLTACTAPQAQAPDMAATGTTRANMPNPASVYCVQNGNRLEIHTAADGSQSGVCILEDGSACDEWAYYRGACGPTPQPSPTATTVVEASTDASASSTRENNPGSFMPPGATEAIADWWGVIGSTPPGAQFDDYFERRDLGQVLYFGIDSLDPSVQAQIVALRDSNRIVHLYGTLLSNVPDYNGSQIQVDRIEVDE